MSTTIFNTLKGIRNKKNIKYLCRASGSNSGFYKQERFIKTFIKKYAALLPPMRKHNTITETVSGTVSPADRFLGRLKKGEPLCMSNLDRALKTNSLEDVVSFRRSLLSLETSVLLANEEEYRGLLELRALITQKKRVLPRYIQFVSDRMNETLSEINASKSSKKSMSISKERKGIRDYCIKYLRLIKDAFDEATIPSPDLRLWIIACFTGHLINQYLKDHYVADSSTRLSNFNVKELLVLRAIEINHPDKNREQIQIYSNKYNKKDGYIIDLNPDRISRLKGSKPYDMLLDYENGDFENDIRRIHSGLALPEEDLSWKGLSKKERRKIAEHFPKIKGLREWQSKTLKSIKQGKHTVLQVMAGGGKSLTFQLPAMMGKVVVEVAPYNRLIQNQTQAINNIIPADFLNSDVTGKKRRSVIKQIREDRLNLLSLTPEQLDPDSSKYAGDTLEALKGRVDLFVIDEAHHPYKDGSDFRSSYNPVKLNKVWKKLGKPQCLFLSASLRKKSCKALKRIINGGKLKIVKGPLKKTNVGLIQRSFEGSVAKADAEKATWMILMTRYLKRQMRIKKIIIYVNSPARVIQVMEQLRLDDNRNVYGVHGRKESGKFLSAEEIKKNQEDFEKAKTGIMVATSAYAEGIDSDAEAVIVLDLPVDIETLYQEVLRCGHRGQKGLAFICVDKKANRFNQKYLLKGDPKKVKEYNKDYDFLAREDDDLWQGLTEPFLQGS